MCDRIGDIASALRRAVARLEPGRLSAADAVQLVEVLAETERLAAAGRTLAAGRVADTRAWRASGQRTAAAWIASRTRGTIRQAIASLETAQHLQDLPATRKEFVSGKLSEIQAAEVASAAAAMPRMEEALLKAAEQQSFVALRERCREVRASAAADEDSVERIRSERYFRHWTDGDGAVVLDGRLAPDDGARLIAAVDARAATLQRAARRSGRREHTDAYAADALVALAGDSPGARAVVHVEVDAKALERGYTAPGETCRIPGVGPVPVATALRLASDGVLKVIGRDGADVTAVVHAGRTIPSRVRTALEARDPTCVVPGCDARTSLEIDHIVPFARGGKTRLDNLARLCRFHHAAKTHHGWRLGGGPGEWTWTKGARPRSGPRPARE